MRATLRAALLAAILLAGLPADEAFAQSGTSDPRLYQLSSEGTYWLSGGICPGPWASPMEFYTCFVEISKLPENGNRCPVLETVDIQTDAQGLLSVVMTGPTPFCTGGSGGVFNAGISQRADGLAVSGLSCLDATGSCANCERCQATVGDRVSPALGNKYISERDYAGTGAFALKLDRTYNSLQNQRPVVAQPLGPRWWTNYDRFVQFLQFGTATYAYVYRPNGRTLSFQEVAGSWVGPADVPGRLEKIPVGGSFEWRYTNLADEVETYDAEGKFLSVANRAGLTQRLTYSNGDGTRSPATAPVCNPPAGSSIPGKGRLWCVTDPFNRQLNFAYGLFFAQSSGYVERLLKMVAPGGEEFSYTYEAGDANLASVTSPSATGPKTRNFRYQEGAYVIGLGLRGAITGVEDENGDRYANYQYDNGRAGFTEHSGQAEKTTLTYNGDGSRTVRSYVNAAAFADRTYTIAEVLGIKRITAISGPACSTCGPQTQTFDTTTGFVTSRSDWNGNRSCFKHDTRGLEIARGEGLTASCPSDVAAWTPAGSTVERKVTTQWHAAWRLPTKLCEPKRITTLVYDTKGNLTTRTEQATSDAQGAQGCSATPVGTARTWTNTYTYGTTNPAVATQIVVNGPRTDVTDTTTYVYEESTGNLLSVTNAVSHQTTLGNYDVHGNPRQITDPNGRVTTLVWDERQRLASRTVGSELTSYTYDGVGQLTRLTLPDASYLEYVYDDAHRLTEVRDNLGNKTTYTLDLAGNRTSDETRDPVGTLRAKRSREYSNLNRLFKDIGGTNPATQITQYGYDNQGNLTSVDGPLTGTPSDLSVMTYDALNRLKDVTDPLSGLTRYTYDGLDQTASVQDPRNNTTSYTSGGLGTQTQEVSPDRGTTNRVFDAAGNLTSSTDARSKTTAYTYDALNRLTQATFQGANPITYAWDQGTGHKGRLTTITFTGGNTTYTYDPNGRVTQKRDTHSTGRVFTVNYAWNATTGRLTSITYPKGKVLTFDYDAAGRVASLTVGSGIIANSIAYFPFGVPSGWIWGNSLTVSRSFDLDGRLTGFPLTTSDSRLVVYDDASRITQIKHPTNPSLVQTMDYDKLDRLTSWVDASSNRAYGYDANGNRTALTIGANNYTYTTPGTTNRLGSTSGPAPARTFAYDAAGNTTGDGQFTLTYNDRGRISQAVKGSTTATYTYDGLGQRVKKTGPTSIVPSGTNYFVYDEQGKLLGEYNSSGALIQEYVWLGTMPVAVLRGTTASPTIFYVYADQIDRPWIITNTANQIRWRWDTSPFGELAANENPAGLGAFAFNQRFPGQYLDKETNLFYNYFRDYDPQTGRYVQSDPIGLEGGLNTYAYAYDNPVSFFDRYGLEVYLAGHPAVTDRIASLTVPPSYHLSLQLIPDNPQDFAGTLGWNGLADGGLITTLGGQPGAAISLRNFPYGNLQAYRNYPGDHPGNTPFRQKLTPPCGMSDTEFINSLIRAASLYSDDRAYDPFPRARTSTYNSNSFVAGVLRAAGATPPALDTGGRFQAPGYERPISLGDNSRCMCRP